MITRYTTPPITVLVKGVNITSYDIYVTVKQDDTEITVTDGLIVSLEGSDTKIVFQLTQLQAGSLDFRGFAGIQVNWIADGVRYATEIARVQVYNNLLDEVIE